jgi:hypothetical protein
LIRWLSYVHPGQFNLENPMSRKANPSKQNFWKRHLEAQPASGLGIKAYCHEHGLNFSS